MKKRFVFLYFSLYVLRNLNNSNNAVKRYKLDDDGNWLHVCQTLQDSLYNITYRTSIYNCVGSLPIHEWLFLSKGIL